MVPKLLSSCPQNFANASAMDTIGRFFQIHLKLLDRLWGFHVLRIDLCEHDVQIRDLMRASVGFDGGSFSGLEHALLDVDQSESVVRVAGLRPSFQTFEK